jgi:hypothetical protein
LRPMAPDGARRLECRVAPGVRQREAAHAVYAGPGLG